MSVTPGQYYDDNGAWSNSLGVQEGAVLYGIDPDSRGGICSRKMQIRSEFRNPLQIGYVWNSNWYLYEETQAQDIGGGCEEWIQKFARIPDSLIKYENIAYNYQFVVSGKIFEIPLKLNAACVYDYGIIRPGSTLPLSIPIQIAPIQTARYVVIGGVVQVVGTPFNQTSVNGLQLAFDAAPVEYRGIIYVRKRTFITVKNHVPVT